MARQDEIKAQLKVLTPMKGMEKEVAKLEAELASLGSNASSAAAPIIGPIVLDVSVEDFEKSGSKFAAAGLHLSEFGLPAWYQTNVSLDFPFTIIEEGPDKGKEAKISVGVSAKAVWKLKEVLTALGVTWTKTAKGNVSFNPIDVVGKQGMTVWETQKDTRSAEEGGKGTTYTKPVSVVAQGSEVGNLGV